MRPIDADALKNRLEDLRSYTMLGEGCLYYDGETNALSIAILNIVNAPTVDAVPVKHGRWIDAIIPNGDKNLPIIVCDQCNTFFPLAFGDSHRYCPNCGAKMDGEKVSE